MKLVYLFSLLAATTAAEVQIEKIESNSCSRPTRNGDMISVHYTGSLEDGTKFDSSYDRNSPLSFPLGAGRVIQGWEQGLLDMCPGDKRKLTIPPELGYGSRGIGPIPGNAVLIFETELVEIAGVDKDEL